MKNNIIVILNYKTWELTVDIIKKIRNIKEIDSLCDIVVVDNNSPNNSFEMLSEQKIAYDYELIGNKYNAGYAAGNNLGLRYSYEKGYEYALVINNDIIFNDFEILKKMLKVFLESDDIAIVSPDIYMPNGYLCNRDSIKPSIWDMSLGALQYRKKGRGAVDDSSNGWIYTYRPQGCCMLVQLKKLNEVDYMDESTFLYCEEPILAERLLVKGYRCACCTLTSVIHNHSFTVKSSLTKWRFIKSNLHSFNYYLKQYRKFDFIQRVWCNIFYIMKLFLTKQI